MVQTRPAKNITLRDLSTKFGLQLVENNEIFREWQDDLQEITNAEKERLDRVEASYANLLKYPPMLENTVKMVVLSALLDLAGFYLPPFHIKSETSIEISAEDDGTIYRGQLDILALSEQFWVTVIESKRASFSIEEGRAQILAYMLANLQPNKPTFGLLMNGASFRFIKLVKLEFPQYAFSKLFDIFNPGENELYDVLRVLKRLGQLAIEL